MKSVGEAMAIGPHVPARRSPRRCARASSTRRRDARRRSTPTSCSSALERPAPDRYDVAARGVPPRRVARARSTQRTRIDPWFLRELRALALDPEAPFAGERSFKSVDTCAAEFAAATPYYYSGWERRRAADEVAARRPRLGRDPRRRAQPHRPGHRVRLLLRARRDDRPRVGPRRGDDQLQPRDGLDRLRHLRPPVLRAADARGRARRRRGRAARGRDRPVRRPDAAEARRRAAWRPACRCWARASTRSTSPRTAGASARCSTGSATRRRRTRTARLGRRGARRSPTTSASRCSCARRYVLGGRAMEIVYSRDGPGRLPARATCAADGRADLPRPLPGERDRGRRRRAVRRRGGLDRRDHAARRGGRHPLGRQRLRAAAALARRRRCSTQIRERRGGIALGARRRRADQRPVRGPRRRACT